MYSERPRKMSEEVLQAVAHTGLETDETFSVIFNKYNMICVVHSQT